MDSPCVFRLPPETLLQTANGSSLIILGLYFGVSDFSSISVERTHAVSFHPSSRFSLVF